MDSYHSEIIKFNGRDFKVSLYYDNDMGAPWVEDDGHGAIREIRPPSEKRPGEIIVNDGRGNYWAYNFQDAIKTAKADGWCCAKTGPEIVEAVQADMDYLRGWLRGDWHYCGISVQLLDSEGEPIGGEFDHALWGVESNGDCWLDAAAELAEEIMYDRAEAWKKHLKERRAVKYWASRDVMTEGARA